VLKVYEEQFVVWDCRSPPSQRHFGIGYHGGTEILLFRPDDFPWRKRVFLLDVSHMVANKCSASGLLLLHLFHIRLNSRSYSLLVLAEIFVGAGNSSSSCLANFTSSALSFWLSEFGFSVLIFSFLRAHKLLIWCSKWVRQNRAAPTFSLVSPSP
jgi:hypothetical protein